MLIALWRIYPQYIGNHLGFSLPYGTLTPKMVLKEWKLTHSTDNPRSITKNTLSFALHY